MILGPSGAGKSTLARVIGQKLGLPVVHLDALFWDPGWTETPDNVFRPRIERVLAGDAWVVDGNYTRTLDLRLPRATNVIYLDLPRRVYFPRAIWRSLRNYGRERDDVGVGNPEKFDVPFFRDWVWSYPHRARAKQVALMADLPPHMRGLTLRSRAEVRAFTDNLPRSLE